MPYFTNLRSKFYYWHLLVALIITRYIFLTVLDFSQYLYISQETVPKDLQNYLGLGQWDFLRKSGFYAFKVEFLENFVYSSFHLALIGFNLLPKSWDLFTSFTNEFLGDFIRPDNAWLRSVLYYVLFYLAKTIVLLIPTLIVFSSHAKDILEVQIQKSSLMLMIALVYFSIFGWIARGHKWVKAGGIMVVVTILYFLLGIYFGQIAPILDQDIQRYPDGQMKQKIIGLLAKTGFNTNNLYYMPGVMNVMTAGIGQMAIIMVGERLLQLYNGHDDQLMAVIGHEIGHWKYYHSILSAVIGSLKFSMYLAIYMALISRPRFYEAFDMKTADFAKSKAVPLGIGLILVEIIDAQMSIIIRPLMNYIGWMKEHACDAYAIKLGMGDGIYGAISKLIVLHPLAIANFAYGLFHSTHPTLAIRLAAIKRLL